MTIAEEQAEHAALDKANYDNDILVKIFRKLEEIEVNTRK
jgi:D-alanine-D-alanine ligase-like ATP-grasp enzyme